MKDLVFSHEKSPVLGGCADGFKSRFEDCLQQSKMILAFSHLKNCNRFGNILAALSLK